MGFTSRRPTILGFLLALPILATTAGVGRGDYSISNNLSGTSGGVELAIGSSWISAGFGSGTTGGILRSVTLLLANSAAGRAEVDIYSDAGLQPGSLVGALALSGSTTTGLSNTTFTASGITLAANTNYWVVLKALTGQFDWSWTASNTGTGAGYQNTWGESDDGGGTWFTYDSYPTQMNVLLASPAAVPEPSTAVLLGIAAVGLAVVANRARTSRPARAAWSAA